MMRTEKRSNVLTSAVATWLAIAGLLAAILVAYHHSFSGPFVFDDRDSIVDNPTIRRLADIGTVLSPPGEGGLTVGGRPIVNLSLAINYALGGTEVRGYHGFNVGVHCAAALLLFALVRRTAQQPRLRERYGALATPLAFATALLWAVHPLLTESVTYVVQRAESLMGMFYLLVLYGFVRGAKASGNVNKGWLLLAWVACALGMATKEVMASAPVIVLLYDRTFVAGSWRTAWSQRKFFYVGLAATWLLLGWLVLHADHRGGTAGLGQGDSVWTYALTQTRSISLYLRLAVWPQPLVFDYGTDAVARLSAALPYALIVVGLVALAAVSLWRWPVVGFLGAWCFAILAPSSSLVPIPVQPMAEHRMYLPLAAIVTLAVFGLYSCWRRGCWWLFAAAALALTVGTMRRNEDFSSAVALWTDTVSKRPDNPRARCYLGDALAAEGRSAEALAQYDEAVRLDGPALARGDRSISTDILVNSGNVLRALGRNDEAAQRYAQALSLDPKLVAAHFNLGAIYLQANRLPDAIDQLTEALRHDAAYAPAHTSLGSALLLAGRSDDAILHYEAALRLSPSAKSQRDLGLAFLYLKRLRDAVSHLEEAARLDPDSAATHEFLGNALFTEGKTSDALAHYRRALELDPSNDRVRRLLESLR